MRLGKLAALLESKGLKAALISKPANLAYLLEFPSSGLLLATSDTVEVLVPALDYWRVADALGSEERVRIIPYSRYELPDTVVKPEVRDAGSWILNRVKELGVSAIGADSTPPKIRERIEGSGVKVNDISEDLLRLRSVKDSREVEAIKKALSISEGALKQILGNVKAGMREYEVAALLESAMRFGGAEGYAFETIIASGPNAAYPHATPTSRALREGDAVVIDFGARFGGYCSDMTRTYVVGRPEQELRKILEAVKLAVDAATDAAAPGVKASEVDAKAREVLRREGLSKFFIHGLGHGVGLEVHERPTLSPSSEEVLEPGMVVTIEPGVYIHRKLGVRIENMVLITKGGRVKLNTVPELI